MPTQTTPTTAEQLLRMSEAPGRRHELVEGELTDMTPAGHEHGRIANRIAARLTEAADLESVGAVYAAETGFVLAREPDTVLAPDAAFVRTERLPRTAGGYFEGPPDLAVEVASPTDRIEEVDNKARRWLEAGVRLVWAVWPQTRSVVVHRPEGEPTILHEDNELTGEDVLPGFTCRISHLFE